MEILIGLAIATVAVVGICAGNLFACVFASLGLLLIDGIAVVFTLAGASEIGPIVIVLSLAVLAIIWAPRLYRQHPPARGRSY
jgi:uncharacterized membrane protein